MFNNQTIDNDIKIFNTMTQKWNTILLEVHKKAYLEFKRSYIQQAKTYYFLDNEFTILRQNNQRRGPIYLKSPTSSMIPIADWKDVKVFLLDKTPVNWYPAYEYQTWSYFDYIYSLEETKKYKSIGTIGYDDHIEIPINNIDPGIVFSISKNENGSVFFEKNNQNRTKIRISDNNNERNGYLGFYHRMTEPIGFSILPPPPPPTTENTYLTLPQDINVNKTLREDIMCSICNDNQQNILFIPCKHTLTCSECYKKLAHPRECPICRKTINQIIKYISETNNTN